jgi:drug/metabolite transporter (DMT)-like permease
MEWFYWAVSAGILFTIFQILSSKLMEKEDQKVISFLFSAIIAILLIPALFIYQMPSILELGIIGVMSIIVVVQNILNFQAHKFISPATINVISKVRLLWIIIGSYFIFNEIFTLQKNIGIALIILASIVLIDLKNVSIKKGISIALIVTVTSSILTLMIKYILTTVHPIFFLFFFALFPAIIQAGIPGNFAKAKDLLQRAPILILSLGIVGALYNIAGNYALKLGDAGAVSLVIQSSIVLILGVEVFFLKRKERIWYKIAAVMLSVLGLALIFLQ